MDWRSVKFDWNYARAFLITVEEGSLSAAARALGVSQPTLSRQVSGLEDDLGVALFERGGKGLELTPSGMDLVEHVKAMGLAASSFSLAASGKSNSIEGNICLSATEVTCAYVLPQILKKLKLAYPGIHVELIASNETSDLRRREADIAIRAYRPTQPDLIARKLIDMEASIYATPEYLLSLEQPMSMQSMNNADFIGFSSTDNDDYLTALLDQGFPITKNNFTVTTDNHLVHWALVKQGVGIGVMPVEIGDAESSVTRVFPGTSVFKGEIWLVSHRELRTSSRVRTVFDFLATEFMNSQGSKPTT